MRFLRYVWTSPEAEAVLDPQDLLRQLMAAGNAAELGERRAGAPPSRTGRIQAAIDAALDIPHWPILFFDAIDGDANLEPEQQESKTHEWCGHGAQRFDLGAVA